MVSPANALDTQKLQSPEIIKNAPPKIKARVVPTAPDTGMPLLVEGIVLRPDEVATAEEVLVAEPVAADWVAVPPIRYGLVVPYGVVVVVVVVA